MPKFLRGNVIISPYNRIEIVVKCTEDYLETMPIDSTNTTIGSKYEDETYMYHCSECGGSGCEKCNNTGEEERVRLGFKHAKYLGENVKSYITETILKSLGLKL